MYHSIENPKAFTPKQTRNMYLNEIHIPYTKRLYSLPTFAKGAKVLIRELWKAKVDKKSIF